MRYTSAGIMIGAQPMMGFPAGTNFHGYALLRNTSNKPLAIQPTLYLMGDMMAGSREIPGISLAAHEVRRLDVSQLLKSSGLDDFAGALTLSLGGTFAPRDLLIVTGSLDDSGSYVFEVMPHLESPSLGKKICFWEVANGTDTMITLWNYSDQNEDVLLTFLFEGGQYVLPVHVPAKSFPMVDVGELIASQAPDSKGNKFPSAARQGSLNISNVSSDPRDRIHLTATAATFNVHTATCGEICDSCNGYDAIAISPSNFSDLLSKTVQLHSYAVLSGQPTAEVTDLTLWTSSDRSVATVSNGGLVTGVAPGGVLLDGTAFLPPSNKYCWDNTLSNCDNVYFEDTAEGTIGCGDNRGYLIKEYATYGVNLSPVCTSFTQSVTTPYWTFQQLNHPEDNEYSDWAILQGYFQNNLNTMRSSFGRTFTITSGYRSPYENWLLPGAASQSRHMYGDAADASVTGTTWQTLRNAARTVPHSCIEPQSDDPTHLHVDWRPWSSCSLKWQTD